MAALIKTYGDMTSFEEHVLLSAIAGDWAEVGEQIVENREDGRYVFSFMINGVEIDAEKFIKTMSDAHDRSVERHAEQIVDEKVKEIGKAIDPLTEMIEDFEAKVRERFDVPKDSWDW